MILPVFHEITFSRTDHDYLREVLLRSPLGEVPCFAVLSDFTVKEVQTLLAILKMVLEEGEINPKFPYPIYIVTKLARSVQSQGINLLTDIKHLPSLFNRKAKRPRAKQAAQIGKIDLLAERVRGLDLKERLQKVNETMGDQDRLFDICLEHNYYENLLRKVRSREKE